MTEAKRIKWDSGVTVSKGKQSVTLLETYKAELSPRISDEDAAQHAANIVETEKRLSGQKTKLDVQKSSTAAQDAVVLTVNQRVISIRKIVTSSGATAEIKKAYGVGDRVTLTVAGVSSAADSIKTAYTLFKDWSNKKGILDKDIEELVTLSQSLYTADNAQESSIFARKAATMDKNTLQREVEDGISRISALGVHEFELSNPAVAKLFADLIPSTSTRKKEATTDKTANA